MILVFILVWLGILNVVAAIVFVQQGAPWLHVLGAVLFFIAAWCRARMLGDEPTGA